MRTGLIRCILSVLLLSAAACSPHKNKRPDPAEAGRQKKLVERANRYLVKQDKEQIEGYIRRHDWHMEVSKGGLYYEIYEHGKGPVAGLGSGVLMNYRVSLLDGTLCYSSEDGGPRKVLVGKGTEVTGLDEALLMCRQGDKARFILPPHMAHGLLGDEDKIPPHAVIVYELEILKVTN